MRVYKNITLFRFYHVICGMILIGKMMHLANYSHRQSFQAFYAAEKAANPALPFAVRNHIYKFRCWVWMMVGNLPCSILNYSTCVHSNKPPPMLDLLFHCPVKICKTQYSRVFRYVACTVALCCDKSCWEFLKPLEEMVGGSVGHVVYHFG